MIEILYSKKNTPYVWASDLHKELEITTPLSTWFPRMIEYGFTEDSDFSQHNKKVSLAQGGYNLKKDWAVRLEMAKHLAMIQRSDRGKNLRDYFISLDQKVQDGKYLSNPQIMVLFDLCKVVGFFTVQKFFEQEHFELKQKPTGWWEYRAKLLGYNTTDLKEVMQALGVKYKSQKQALMHVDKYELIRTAIMDMFLALGKNEEYAKNLGNFAKSIALEIKPEIYDDTDTSIDFKTPQQRVLIENIRGYKNNGSLLNKF